MVLLSCLTVSIAGNKHKLIAPENLTAKAISSTEIDLKWIYPITNEIGFIIQKSLDNTNWVQLAIVSNTITFYADKTCKPSQKVYYKVEAFN